MANEIEFELDGFRFKGTHLDPETSLDGWALLAPALGAIADSIKIEEGDDDFGATAGLIKGLLGGMKDLPKFRPLFLKVYKCAPPGSEVFAPLSATSKQVFEGRPALHVGWLVSAVHAEYATFLAPSGRAILSQLVSRFGFQTTSSDTGRSGD